MQTFLFLAILVGTVKTKLTANFADSYIEKIIKDNAGLLPVDAYIICDVTIKEVRNKKTYV